MTDSSCFLCGEYFEENQLVKVVSLGRWCRSCIAGYESGEFALSVPVVLEGEE